MPATANKLTSIVEDYLSDLRRVRASGGATGERSTYGPLANLLNDVGATLVSGEGSASLLPKPPTKLKQVLTNVVDCWPRPAIPTVVCANTSQIHSG